VIPLGRVVYGVMIILLLASAVGYVQADISGRFPDTGDYNGMYLDYTISGVSLDSSKDTTDVENFVGGDTTQHTRKLYGKVTGKTVTLSGTLHGKNIELSKSPRPLHPWVTTIGYAKLSVDVLNGDQDVSLNSGNDPFTEKWSRPFMLTKGAPSTDYNPVEIEVEAYTDAYDNGDDPQHLVELWLFGEFSEPSSVPNVKPSSASPQPVPPPSEPGIPWVLIVGPLAIAAIAAIAAAKTLGKKKPEEKKEKKDKGPTQYILQISPVDTIKVSTKEGGSFTATAWKVNETGGSPGPFGSAPFRNGVG